LSASSDHFSSGEEADATTILRYLIVREILLDRESPNIVVELMDTENVSLLPSGVESIVSPTPLSHMLAQVALRRELHTVFDHLFSPAGADITLAPASSSGIVGQKMSFEELKTFVQARGDVVLGLRRSGVILLNPDRGARLTLAESDELILLTNV
jgi:hypothetical protein